MIRKLILLTAVFVFSAALSEAAGRAAGMRPMPDDEMARISGAGGISIAIQDLAIYMHVGSLSYTDTDTGDALTLENLTLSNGGLRPAAFATGHEDLDGDGIISPLTFDVTTVSDPASAAFQKTMIALSAPDWLQQVHLHVDAVRFCGEDLGRLDVGLIHRPSFYWLLGAHSDGIDFEHGLRLSVDALLLTYNQRPESFELSGIHLGAYDPGDPQDPETWGMTGLFQIGDVHGGHPATFDVGRDGDGRAAVVMNLPMQGALRVENLHWEGADFGPIALDGIRVHRLNVSFTP